MSKNSGASPSHLRTKRPSAPLRAKVKAPRKSAAAKVKAPVKASAPKAKAPQKSAAAKVIKNIKVKVAKKPVVDVKKKEVLKDLDITVVDKHHHVLKPIWDAVAQGRLPRRGVKLLHFDSHPDMGCFGAGEFCADGDSKARTRYERIVAETGRIFANRIDETECLRLSDIATWIPTLVAQGLVDEVIWVAGWWCDQFPSGSWELLVGKSKADGMMKIAVPGDRKFAMLDYWGCDDSVVKVEELEMIRPWTLHVAKFRKAGCLGPKDAERLAEVCSGNHWILDIDEDYLSTQNPFSVEFSALYGEDLYQELLDIWNLDAPDLRHYNDLLKQTVEQDVVLLPEARFLAHPLTREVAAELRAGGYGTARVRSALVEWRRVAREILPGRPDKSEHIHVRQIKDVDFLVTSGNQSGLPHHLSTIHEMVAMLRSTRSLFQAIGSPPGVVTVATSRFDEYTPETQADTINELVLDLVGEAWPSRRTVLHRRDFNPALSIFHTKHDTIYASPLALFLSRGRKSRLPPPRKAPRHA